MSGVRRSTSHGSTLLTAPSRGLSLVTSVTGGPVPLMSRAARGWLRLRPRPKRAFSLRRALSEGRAGLGPRHCLLYGDNISPQSPSVKGEKRPPAVKGYLRRTGLVPVGILRLPPAPDRTVGADAHIRPAFPMRIHRKQVRNRISPHAGGCGHPPLPVLCVPQQINSSGRCSGAQNPC